LHVTQFTVRATSEHQWQATGQGKVEAEHPDHSVVVWRENGCWDEGLNYLSFSNAYRWTQFSLTGLQLEHLRYGEEQAVQLVKLIDHGEGVWKSLAPHDCGQDQYHLRLDIQENNIILDWHISGPNKTQRSTISYR